MIPCIELHGIICFRPEFNISDVWVNFKDLLFAVVKDVVPIGRHIKKRNPWITNEIVTLSRKKHRAFNAARRNPTNNYLWTEYKSIRNKVKYLTAQSYANFMKDLSQNCSSSPKRCWSFVNSQRGKSSPNCFRTANGSVFTDHLDIANNFNSIFQSNFTIDKADSISSECTSACSHSSQFRLCDIVVTVDEVKKLLKSLNMYKSAGPDDVSPMLRNLASDSLAEPLTKLFNFSLPSGTVPTEWKLANVVPLYKSGDSHDMSNYRPISLCSTVGKILEKIVSKHLVNHMYRSGIITDVQHGFIPKRSCITQLTTLYHE